ncbi:MAG: PIG-L family deacetylase [Candidatus Cyclobacteriaceae bacterium M2_1C_046]
MTYRILALLFISFASLAQPITNPDAAEILHDIQKLKVLGSALYVAAHPDDENTRLIAWLANEKKVETAYLAMTRGDGGQNLIGPEIREKLGIIRTQELLEARRIDGGRQYFTRANDFGYSKSPEETLEVWNEDKILSDVVWVIRKFRPDIIITRFPADGGGGHGHHTASAQLAHKAFKLASDPNAYPEQLKYVKVWQPKRLYLNTGRWWNPDISADEPGVLSVNVGKYSSLLGTSYTEMAARSRSMHKSQGFGATGTRGNELEYLEHRLGDQAREDIFEDIDIGWSSVGAPEIEDRINNIIKTYNPLEPSESVNSLLRLRNEISLISNEHWKEFKINDLDKIIQDVLGLYFEATVDRPYLVPGEKYEVNLELVNRSDKFIIVDNIQWPSGAVSDSLFTITPNESTIAPKSLTLSENTDFTAPYWLKNRPEKGYYVVNDLQKIGKPENDPELEVSVVINFGGNQLKYNIPLHYKWNDPVKGEQRRAVAIVPPVALNFAEEIYLFPSEEGKEIRVKAKNLSSTFNGEVKLNLPQGWQVTPASINVTFIKPQQEQELIFTVYPPKAQTSVVAELVATSNGEKYNSEVDEIAYDHIPIQTLVTKADAEFVNLDVKIAGNRVGYIEGAGDAIPATLRELGYEVDILVEEQLSPDNLDKYNAIILGIRTLNTVERIDFMMPELLEYVKRGGVLITQYNTSFRLKTQRFAPYPLQLSRDRVTVEEAPITVLAPRHPALNYPNKINAIDFDKWVQERGLYFPNQWDEKYIPLFAVQDPGEETTMGSLLIAPYGEGHYVYSGISWFRQLPAGVPGAIRIFANLISLGSSDKRGN